MENNLAISVIVPVYNVEKYLARCLDSLLAQTFGDFEIICVNDGSADGSLKILQDYAARDPRIKIINQQNQGLSMARNNGLKIAQGKYIYFLDSDDYIHPQLLEITHNFITKYNADLVSFMYDMKTHKAAKRNARNFKHVWQNYKNINKIPHKFTNNPLKFYRRKFGFKICDYIWQKLYKKEILDHLEFIPNIYFEDTPHTISLLKKRPKTILLKEPLYFYNHSPQSITNFVQHKNLLKTIQSRYAGLLFIYEAYRTAPKDEFDFVAKNVIMKYLKDQFGDIQHAPQAEQPELLKLFTRELTDLDSKKFMGLKLRRLNTYLKFKKIIKQAKSNYENAKQ
ncbi:MAG: glycosyltransferase family 2 protein [Endomicrobium sp.]|jgi:glycosyltransferase involved in cell wall biosynthesis|nr:glycosyltransferase family 2 protein [Endomicrobium sp.]